MTDGLPRALVAGNWKMNGTSASLAEVRLLAEMLKGVKLRCDVMICPPATLLTSLHRLLGTSGIKLGGQDTHPMPFGAFTGDIAANMLKDAGASAVIVGHSERRIGHGETNEIVLSKAVAAHRAGLLAILCIGETGAERQAGRTLDVITSQLEGSFPKVSTPGETVIAYEPVWAIGTGLTPTAGEIAEAHAHIRREIVRLAVRDAAQFSILYGGSVKPSNAASILDLENVNGALVGGASLKAADFIGIIKAYS